jgi:hypothetical protein
MFNDGWGFVFFLPDVDVLGDGEIVIGKCVDA